MTYVILYFVIGLSLAIIMSAAETPQTAVDRLLQGTRPTKAIFLERVLFWPYVLLVFVGQLLGRMLYR